MDERGQKLKRGGEEKVNKVSLSKLAMFMGMCHTDASEWTLSLWWLYAPAEDDSVPVWEWLAGTAGITWKNIKVLLRTQTEFFYEQKQPYSFQTAFPVNSCSASRCPSSSLCTEAGEAGRLTLIILSVQPDGCGVHTHPGTGLQTAEGCWTLSVWQSSELCHTQRVTAVWHGNVREMILSLFLLLCSSVGWTEVWKGLRSSHLKISALTYLFSNNL